MKKSSRRKFTLEELAQCNGKDGSPAYIAYKGKVYDVSHSYHWKDGKHQVLHQAGQDLTEAMNEAPHSDELMERMPIVGILMFTAKPKKP